MPDAPDFGSPVPGFDPAVLQQLLAQSPPPAPPPITGPGPNIPPRPAPQPVASPDIASGIQFAQPQPAPPQQTPLPLMAPDLGSGQSQQQGPPRMSGAPLLARMLHTMFKGGGYAPAPPGQPGRPLSRLDAFEGFLGEFLNSFSQGLAAGGTGPGANMRGAAAAIQAPHQRELQQYQMGMQQQMAQAQTEETQARTRQMGQMVTLPNGMTMPLALAQKVYPAMISGQAKVEAAGVQKRFLTTPFGVYDTQTQQYAGGGGMAGTVKVLPEMADQYGLPKELVGKQVKLTDLAALERGAAMQVTAVQGAEGPALVNKITTKTTKLRLGSPAANAIAQGKLSLAQKVFERDTFGTLMGAAIPSSLVDETGTTIGWKSPAAPTSSIKTQAQQASDLSQLFKKVQTQLALANQQGKLGPGAGRINEFLTGRVGADDPLFAEIRALGSLTASGMLKAHFGARGGQQMYDHFEALFNTGKMTYGDLTGAMKGFSTFMDQYASRVRTAKQAAGDGAAAGGALPKIDFTPVQR